MKALVVFSGGQDSTTCLGWAKNRYDSIEAITFNYGQKHKIEIEQSKKICEYFHIPQHIISMDFLKYISDSALISEGNVNEMHPRLKHLPASFVPNRNAVFLTIAHALAQKNGAEVLVTGVCQTDFSGYPDCRLPFIRKMQDALWIGSECFIKIETPLMNLIKAEIFKMAEQEGVLDIILNMSHTCYNGIQKKNDWGFGCGECPACKLRKKGWNEFISCR